MISQIVGSESWFIVALYSTILFSGFYMPLYTTIIMTQADPKNTGEISGMLS